MSTKNNQSSLRIMPRLKNLRSFDTKRHHIYDQYKNTGYDYEGNILRNALSPEIFANPLNDLPMSAIEGLLHELIDCARKVKLQFAISYDKDSTQLN